MNQKINQKEKSLKSVCLYIFIINFNFPTLSKWTKKSNFHYYHVALSLSQCRVCFCFLEDHEDFFVFVSKIIHIQSFF